MVLTIRAVAAAAIACMGLPAAAAHPGASAGPARDVVTVTASVAAQARLTSDAQGACLWSNTATRLLAITVADGRTAGRRLTPGDTMVAAETPDCASGGRLGLATLRAGGDARTILVSPE